MEKIDGYGASATTTTLVHHYEMGNELDIFMMILKLNKVCIVQDIISLCYHHKRYIIEDPIIL